MAKNRGRDRKDITLLRINDVRLNNYNVLPARMENFESPFAPPFSLRSDNLRNRPLTIILNNVWSEEKGAYVTMSFEAGKGIGKVDDIISHNQLKPLHFLLKE